MKEEKARLERGEDDSPPIGNGLIMEDPEFDRIHNSKGLIDVVP